MTRRAYLSTFGATALIIGMNLLTSVLIARNLGPDGRGVLLAVTIWPAMLVGFMSLGLNEATVYHTARNDPRTDEAGGARHYAASGLVLQVVVAVVATAVTLALLPFLVRGHYAAWLGVVLLYAAAYGPLTVLDQHFKAVLQGEGRFDALSVVRIGPPFVYAGLLFLFLIAGRLTVETVLVAMVASFLVTAGLGAALAGVRIRGATREGMRATLATGVRFHAGNMLSFAATEADKLIVLALLDVTAAGFYAVAVALSPLGTVAVVQSLGIVLAREMARADSPAERVAVFATNLLTAFVLLFALNGLAAALAPWWLPLVYGSAFGAAVTVVAVLFVMGAIKGLRQITDRAMRGMHNASVGAAGEAVALVLTVAFAFAGARLAGLEGLAWGLVLAQGIAFAMMLWLALRVLGIGLTDLVHLLRRDAARLPALAWREAMLVRSRLR